MELNKKDPGNMSGKKFYQKEKNQITDWIAPGEYRYCHCGSYLIPNESSECGSCKYRPKLDDFICPCGEKASMIFIHGARCSQHAYETNPSFKFGDEEKLVGTSCQIRHDFDFARMQQEPHASIATHKKLCIERTALAEKRISENIEPFFWMD